MAEVNMSDLKPNSQTAYREESKRVQPVATGTVTRKSKSLGRKFADFFFDEMSLEDAVKAFLYDQLFPAIKDGIHDVFFDFVDTLFYGKPKAHSKRGSSNGSYTSYGSYSSGNQRTYRSTSNRILHDFDDILFDNMEDASNVLDEMLEIVNRYKEVSVGDFYSAAKVPRNGHTDEEWGWTDLKAAYIDRVRQGRETKYMIVLPKAVSIKD